MALKEVPEVIGRVNGVNGVNGVNEIIARVFNGAQDHADRNGQNSTTHQNDINGQSTASEVNGLHEPNGLSSPKRLSGLNGINRVNGYTASDGYGTAKGHATFSDHKNHSNGLTENTTQAEQNKHDIKRPSPNVGASPPAIAVVGIGLRLPGNIKSTDDFWDLLIRKGSTRRLVPKDRYNIDAFYSASGKPGTVNSLYGHYLECELDRMDASFFSMSKAEVESLDPQQRLLLEVIWECMESGGQKNWRGTNTGVYVGVYGDDWADLSAKDPQHLAMYRITSSTEFALANRVSYEFDLKGPSMTIRTGCSSSLVGLHEACQALSSGACKSALVAGTSILTSPTLAVTLAEQGVLSSTGSCKSFDAKADGYARGEAINAVYIKLLSDALANGDPVRGVIRATGINFDGKTSGITNPSPLSQEALIRKTYQSANIDNISDTAFVECHGTGTPVGDPLETSAIGKAFGSSKDLWIGSVKPNVGHSEGASGLTSLIKGVLALEHEMIPPNVNFSAPNPKIKWREYGLKVPTEPIPWPSDHAARVSVNNFGIGGANAHVIIDSAKPYRKAVSSKSNSEQYFLAFSANHPESLKTSIENIAKYMKAHPDRLADISYTLAARREYLAYRAYAVTDGDEPLQVSPTVKFTRAPSLNFVFTGQGAQWGGMGADLLTSVPSFKTDIQMMDKALRKLPHAPLWTIEKELLRPAKQTRLNQSEFSQPICTAVQIGLVNLLRSWNVHPSAVVGHSSGEIAAAYAAGALSLEAAVAVAYYRGQVMKLQLRAGGMAAVALGRSAVTPYLEDGIVIACENSPINVTLSGDSDKIDAVVQRIKKHKPGCFVRRLKVEQAYHSHHMQEISDLYESLLGDVGSNGVLAVPFFSSVTGEQIGEHNQLGPSYWRTNMESPVLFSTAIQSMLQFTRDNSLFLEIGPHSALSGPLRDIFKSVDATSALYMSTLVRNESSTKSMLNALGRLFQEYIPVDITTSDLGRQVLTDLPTYAWHHDAGYWNESRVSRDWRLRKFPHHELLGTRILEADDLEPTWRNVLRLDDVPWVRDHKIKSDIVLPGAAYIAMAGEAIRQASETEEAGFSLRQVDLRKALVLRDTEHTEVITHLRPVRLTSNLDSVWWEFSIASYNGDMWVKHCNGQVKVGNGNVAVHETPAEHNKLVSSPVWYRAMKKIGLNYGSSFQGLRDISVAPGQKTAAASVTDRDQVDGSKYFLHPTTIDLCLQLLITSNSEGSSRHLTKLCIPTYIGEIQVCQGGCGLRLVSTARTSANGTIYGTTVAIAGDQLALKLKDVRLSPLQDGGISSHADTVAAAQLHWKPDIDFATPAELIRPFKHLGIAKLNLERLSLLCMLETLDQVKDIDVSGHLSNFRVWMHKQRERSFAGHYDHIHDAARLASLDGEALKTEKLVALHNLCESSSGDVGSVMINAADNAVAIYRGEVQPIEILMQDGGLQNIYDFIQRMADITPYFELLGHAKPMMKILEIGAGTGGTTVEVLRGITSTNGEQMYGQYDYTDISTGFFGAAQERFQDYKNIRYKTLDISKDPHSQGFEAESYDLILASNVLHATPCIQETLRNVRKLLKDDGRLFLQELSPVFRMFNFIMGFLPGWWLGEAEGRVEEPYISPSRWDIELKQAGFSGTDAVVYDDELPYQINANIIARAGTSSQSRGEITILSDIQSQAVQALQRSLTQRGFSVSVSSLEDPPKAATDVISLLDIEAPYFHEISSERLSKMQAYLSQVSPGSGLLWVTGYTQVGCKDPQYAASIGVLRTIRSELLWDSATLEVDITALDTAKIVDVFDKFRCRIKGPELDPDYEYAIVDKSVLIPRYRWIHTRQELQQPVGTSSRKLRPGFLGQLQSLQWVEKESLKLQDHEVEIEPRAVGMNFRDVMVVMGIIEGFRSDLGVECGGIVRRIGKTVQDVAVGDRVMIFHHGCFSTTFIALATQLVKIPDSLSFEEAATMPCVYTTVIQALINVGNLSKDQTVLVHSACGGVGIAAINICKMIDAKIFATVGTLQKAQYLTDNYNIPSSNIFNSRNESFYTDLMSATNGRGVDLVLNSLSGELLHLSWKCVARFGKMLEIGKRDFIGQAMLSMDLFEANRMFCGIDMSEIAVDRPQQFRKIMDQCINYYQKGHIKPVTPVRTFCATKIHDAFRAMQQGDHIGKIVVTMPQDAQEIPLTPVMQITKFRGDVSYLLIGGLGGLGRAISSWMVEHGARHLMYLSRSGGDSARDQSFICELASQGCSVQTFKGDVAQYDNVVSLVRKAAKPIAGVLHMSLVLNDQSILNFSRDDWHAAIKPKFDGALNLHNALGSTSLDFFVLFSSLSYVVGQAGQANYAAANSYLAAFTQYRHSLDLPASVLNIGIVEDVGYVSENAAILAQFKAMSYHTLQEADLLDALAFSLLHQTPMQQSSTAYVNPAELTIGLRCTKPLSDANNRAVWKRDIRMAMAHHTKSSSAAESSSSSNKDLSQFLARLGNDPTMLDIQSNREYLTQQIGASIYNLMFRPTSEIDVSLTLPALGVDSLVAIEVCNWWRHTLGMNASVLEIMSAGSIASLGNLAAEGLKRLHAAPTPVAVSE